MWRDFVEDKEEWVGGELHEFDNICGHVKTTITDVKVTEEELDGGEIQRMFHVMGKDFSMSCDTHFIGVGGISRFNGLPLRATWGEWELVKKKDCVDEDIENG